MTISEVLSIFKDCNIDIAELQKDDSIYVIKVKFTDNQDLHNISNLLQKMKNALSDHGVKNCILVPVGTRVVEDFDIFELKDINNANEE